jgi:hypothetical protein
MNFIKYKELVAGLTIGKQLQDAVYVHKIQLRQLPTSLGLLTIKAIDWIALILPDNLQQSA